MPHGGQVLTWQQSSGFTSASWRSLMFVVAALSEFPLLAGVNPICLPRGREERTWCCCGLCVLSAATE